MSATEVWAEVIGSLIGDVISKLMSMIFHGFLGMGIGALVFAMIASSANPDTLLACKLIGAIVGAVGAWLRK